MALALQRLAAEDPSFRVETDQESGQTIMKGMGELHLDILVDRMKREFKVEANIGRRKWPTVRRFRGSTEIDYTHKKQTAVRAQSHVSSCRSIRQNRAKATRSRSKIVGGAVPRNTLPRRRKGIQSSWTRSFGGLPVSTSRSR